MPHASFPHAAHPAPVDDRVVVVAYRGLCVFEFGVSTELFGLPRPELGDRPWYRFEVVAGEPGEITGLGGVRLEVPHDLEAIATAGTVVIPGWRDVAEPPPEPLLEALRRARRAGARIVTFCSGVFVAAAAGLLDGGTASTHWRYADELARRFPAISVRPDVLYVDDGAVLSSAGSAAALDLGLHLIARDHGAEVANIVARRLVMAPHRVGGQAQFIDRPTPDPVVGGVQTTMAWALEHLDRDLPVAVLAEHALMSPRTFARRFVAETGRTPHRWLVEERIRRARELLESTELSVDRIAHACGFASAAALRPPFVRITRTTPTAYRRTFTAVGA